MPLSADKLSWLESLTVAKLKEELKQRGLSVSGLKAELQKRLIEGLEQEEGQAEEAPQRSPEATPQEDKPEQEQPDEQPEASPKAVQEPGATPATATNEQAEPPQTTSDPSPKPARSPSPTHPPAANSPVQKPEQAPASEEPAQPAKEPSPQPESEPAAEPEEEPLDYGDEGPSETAQEEAAAAGQPSDKPDSATPAGEEGSTKKRRAVIQFQPKAKPTPEQTEGTPAAGDADVEQPDASGSPQAAASPAAEAAAPAADKDGTPAAEQPAAEGVTATCAVRIDGLTRPFTEQALKGLLSQTGTIQDFWMPSIKTHALVIFETEEQASATLEALDGKKWPAENPKLLKVTYLTADQARDGIEAGRNPQTARPIIVRRVSASGQVLSPGGTDAAPGAGGDGGGATDAAPAQRVPIRMGMGAVAAAKAALQAAAAEVSLKRGRSLDGSEPAAKRVHGDQEVEDADMEPAVLSLDTLFNKTDTKPCLYWLPLTDDQVKEKNARLARLEAQRDAQSAAPMGGGPHSFGEDRQAPPYGRPFNNGNGRGPYNNSYQGGRGGYRGRA